jgi:hypothetical protein
VTVLETFAGWLLAKLTPALTRIDDALTDDTDDTDE